MHCLRLVCHPCTVDTWLLQVMFGQSPQDVLASATYQISMPCTQYYWAVRQLLRFSGLVHKVLKQQGT